ncbi:hypothetical protein GLOTRDRAFT_97244 [Gloeophyllum trabeum ATCC 11539]|uniref:Uncharacterized protein n=1 Tax=Gloeophyllum trabeum (strain ATCC 11539 / FP-39264 / Madison 617) TaxID=670483 RepID=S7RCG1_GLOTA|nr:uncharacterized protein GLOTRDRAFT_97244 [Gloeophyllum trabeum ATCC 11539]EPQ50074.1 hypothetical protein GLOTRDRAFT_97244 [Gloeophyllum trabeum ATCC 11539]
MPKASKGKGKRVRSPSLGDMDVISGTDGEDNSGDEGDSREGRSETPVLLPPRKLATAASSSRIANTSANERMGSVISIHSSAGTPPPITPSSSRQKRRIVSPAPSSTSSSASTSGAPSRHILALMQREMERYEDMYEHFNSLQNQLAQKIAVREAENEEQGVTRDEYLTICREEYSPIVAGLTSRRQSALVVILSPRSSCSIFLVKLADSVREDAACANVSRTQSARRD